MNVSGIFDTHAHYDDEKFSQDRASALSFVKENGVSFIINCGCDYESSLSTVALSKEYDYVYPAVGLHPENITENYIDELEKINCIYKKEKIVAVGEIGLDYYWVKDNKETQIEVFEKQVILANELNLPVIVHDREAHEDTLNVLKKYKPKGVLHCFTGSAEMAKEVLKLGMYIGIGGAITFKNAKKPVKVCEDVPIDRILLETDCPYMAPVPFRGKRNDSSLIAFTAQKIAEIKQTDVQSVVDTCAENAQRLFLGK